ncbi:MAG TPA: alpha/beta fold hydrolase [Candidatus Sulfotelmatobacter sp.]|jgi:cholest-4-en-3-one 26-monooxygenase|nr:alpha/beta fold hydrolase [Candidatus Sulfotelmatobacter sp.]
MGLDRSTHQPDDSAGLAFHSFILPDQPGNPALRYGIVGPEDGPVLLLLHGYTDSSLSFSRLIEQLPPHVRLVVPDQRGHGASAKSLSSHRRRDFAKDAAALLDHLGIRRPVVVVGHSLGTLTAQRIAADFPERVAGLVLIGAAAGASANAGLLELKQALDALEQAPDRDFIRDFQTGTVASPLPEPFLDAVIGESAQVPLHVWRRVLDDLLDGREDVSLAAVRAPTLLIWGEQDAVFSRDDQQVLLRELADAELRAYARTGHAPHWERPELVAADLVDFLRRRAWRVPFLYDLADPDLYDQGIPHQAFALLRRQPGLAWNAVGGDAKDGFWSVGRIDELTAVSRDPAVFSSAKGHVHIHNIDADALAARASMIDMDPPDHTRLRQLVNPFFTPKAIRDYAPIIRKHAGALLDGLLTKGGGDWVEAIAKPIPISVISDILGLPPEDHGYMIELSDQLVASTSSRPPLDETAYGNRTPLRLLPFGNPAAHGMAEYARNLGERRRAEPKDDLVSRLVTVEVGGERLTDHEFTSFFRLLVLGGNETTRSAISHLALQLAAFPDQFERVRRDPSLLDGAVEESVRFSSPVLYFRRTATRDTYLDGTYIAEGDRVVIWYASANFDESRFTNPLRFDIGRSRAPGHVAYGGGGVHNCIGAALARLEIGILLEEILARNLKIEVAGPPVFVNSNFVNGLEKLNVRLSRKD